MGYAIAMQEKFRYNGQQWLKRANGNLRESGA